MELNTNGNGKTSSESTKEKNIYLDREKCFLCHCSNPNPSKNSDDESDEGTCGDECGHSQPNDDSASCDDNSASDRASRSSTNSEINRLFGFKATKKLTKMPLWMCNECKKNCEEEEKQNKILKVLLKLRYFHLPIVA